MSRIQRSKIVLIVTLLSVLAHLASTGMRKVVAQDRQPIIVEKPKSYFPGDFSKHGGRLFVDPGRPAGVFVGYPAESQDMPAFIEELKNLVAKMFLNDAKDLVWSSQSLPAHKGIESEAGMLMSAFTDKKDVQLAFYSRADGIGYGYFAMRYKPVSPGEHKCPDGEFLDPSGGGVALFDEFANSIRLETKQ